MQSLRCALTVLLLVLVNGSDQELCQRSSCALSLLQGQCHVDCNDTRQRKEEQYKHKRPHKIQQCILDRTHSATSQNNSVAYVEAYQFEAALQNWTIGSQEAMDRSNADAASERWKKYRCAVVNFYSSGCPFSAEFAEDFERLALLYPDLLLLAVDVRRIIDSSMMKLGFQFGIAGTPTLILLVDRKPVARLEAWEPMRLDIVVDFLRYNTDLRYDDELWTKMATAWRVSSNDYHVAQHHWLLWVAVTFCLAAAVYAASMNQTVRRLCNALQRDWMEMDEGQQAW